MPRLLLALVALLALAAPAEAAAPVPPSKIVAKLNAERARLGLFADVAENPGWSSKCAAHNRWMKLNNRMEHGEDEGTPGYTEGGSWAGATSVLSAGDSWRDGNPWANAPIHLSQVYHPKLASTGASEAHGHNCLVTLEGYDHARFGVAPDAPVADHVFTMPVDGGVAPMAQAAAEAPYIPQEKVGIPADQTTGPYLYVWAVTDYRAYPEDHVPPPGVDDPAANDPTPLGRLVRGGLVEAGSGKAVAVKVIDDAAVDGYVGAGNGWLLPPRPLKKHRAYRATVVLAPAADDERPQREVTYTWAFRTSDKIQRGALVKYRTRAQMRRALKRCSRMRSRSSARRCYRRVLS